MKRKTLAVDSVGEDFRQRIDIFLQSHELTCVGKVLAPYPAKGRVVPQQIGEFGSLLYEMSARKSGDLFIEVCDSEHFA